MKIIVDTKRGRGTVAGFASTEQLTLVIVVIGEKLEEFPIKDVKVVSVEHTVGTRALVD